MTEPILTSVANQIGWISLNRPQSLNALSLGMVRTLMQTLLAWRDDPAIRAVVIQSSTPKVFCAGGDIRFFHQAGSQPPAGGSALLEDFFTEEYALNYLIHHYQKPTIALLDGLVMGGGMGLCQSGPQARLRIVSEHTRMAMPEVLIGLFPDVGATYFLSRTPGCIGVYLALTGHSIGAADALYAGLADLYLPSAQLPALVAMVLSVQHDRAVDLRQEICRFAAPFQSSLSAGLLAGQQAVIDHHFSGPDMATIMASLMASLARQADTDPFVRATLAEMQKGSPQMQCVTLEQLKRGATMGLAESLRMERTLVRHCFEGGETLEGIRALIIDKDHTPRWNPARLELVTAVSVQGYFSAAWPAHAHPLRDLP